MRALAPAVLSLPAPGVAGDPHLLVPKRGDTGLPNSGVFLRDPGWGVGASGGSLSPRQNCEVTHCASSLAPLISLLSSVSRLVPSSLCQRPGIHAMVGLGLQVGF